MRACSACVCVQCVRVFGWMDFAIDNDGDESGCDGWTIRHVGAAGFGAYIIVFWGPIYFGANLFAGAIFLGDAFVVSLFEGLVYEGLKFWMMLVVGRLFGG